MTDTPPKHTGASLYACRHWIEQGFRGLKRGGWQWGRTRRTDPVRVARHLLALAVATLLAVAYGTRLEEGPRPAACHRANPTAPSADRHSTPAPRAAPLSALLRQGCRLPPPPAGPQPPVGPRLADPRARTRPQRRPALPVAPHRLKPAPPFHSPPAPAEAAPPPRPDRPCPDADRIPGPRTANPRMGRPVSAGGDAEHGSQHPGTARQGRNTRLMHPENTPVKGDPRRD